MIVGRPGDTITLQFSRPGAAKPTPWRITLPRVLPRQTVRIPGDSARREIAPSTVSAPISTNVVNAVGQSPLIIRGPDVGIRLVVTCNEKWNNRYGHQQEAEADYTRMVTLPLCSTPHHLVSQVPVVCKKSLTSGMRADG
jgi:hypothetical protein